MFGTAPKSGANTYSGKNADIILLQQQIAGDLAEKLRSTLSTSEKQQITKQGTQNPEAYELYLKGPYSWNKRTPSDTANAISYFNQAIAKDPGYALAYSGLADAYAILVSNGGTPSEDFPKSNAAARKALDLDSTLAHPHAVLGNNEMDYDWDFAGGEAEFKKSFELDPNDATAHQWYAAHLGTIGGREQKALAEANRAHLLDPLSPIISYRVGAIHIWARQYDEAIVVCKKLASDNPTFAVAHNCLARAYWGKRMYPQVIENGRPLASSSAPETNLILLRLWNKDFVQRAGRALSPKALKPGKRNARPATRLRTRLLPCMPTWETKIRLSSGSTLLIRSATGCCRV
jgi:adenylate cyclase